MAIINPTNPERKRPRYYEDFQMNLAARPQNLIPQFSQLNVTPQYGVTRLGGTGNIGQSMDRGSVTPSEFPDSNPAGLGVPPSLLPRPQYSSPQSSYSGSSNINKVMNKQTTTSLINPALLPASQAVIPINVGSFGKNVKHKKTRRTAKKEGFHGI